MKKKDVLVIVAHPDDETIWCGGTLLKNKEDWDITIISLCRKNDKDRAPKFKKACEIFNAKCLMSDLEDETLENIPKKEIINRIKEFIDGKNFDYVFTHGSNGEYGHKRHIDVHKAVTEMLKNKMLSAKKIFFFSYLKKDRVCHPNKNADKFINLNGVIASTKKEAIKNIYGFKKNSFEEECCKKIEAFETRELI